MDAVNRGLNIYIYFFFSFFNRVSSDAAPLAFQMKQVKYLTMNIPYAILKVPLFLLPVRCPRRTETLFCRRF